MRSRAVSFPALCSRSLRSSPPPASASAEMRRSSSILSLCLTVKFSCVALCALAGEVPTEVPVEAPADFSSDKPFSLRSRGLLRCSVDDRWLPGGLVRGENPHRQMRGQPYRTQQQDDAQQQLGD